MKDKLVRKALAVGCAVTLFLTVSGISAYGEPRTEKSAQDTALNLKDESVVCGDNGGNINSEDAEKIEVVTNVADASTSTDGISAPSDADETSVPTDADVSIASTDEGEEEDETEGTGDDISKDIREISEGNGDVETEDSSALKSGEDFSGESVNDNSRAITLEDESVNAVSADESLAEFAEQFEAVVSDEQLVGDYKSGYWSYTVANKKATITAYGGNSGSIVIPSSLGGYPVATINSKVLEGKGITGVSIPSSVEKIGDRAFYGCKKLSRIQFYAANCTLGDGVFLYAGKDGDGITVTFGSGVKKIPNNIFGTGNATSRPRIKKVTISSSVTEIGEGAFKGCSLLSSVSIGSGVTSIGKYAFQGTKIGSITIPSKASSIGYRAFNDCKELKIINFNAASCTAGGEVFRNAGKNSGGVAVSFGSGVKKIPNDLFYLSDVASSPLVTKVTIPGSATEVGNGAFNGCGNLSTVSLGKGVTVIGSKAFRKTNITSLSIPESVRNIGDEAFDECRNLKTIIYNAVSATVGKNVFRNAGRAGGGVTAAFGTTVKIVPNGLFYSSESANYPRVTRATIASNVAEIGANAFHGCADLTTVTMGTGVVKIGANAFQGTKISQITIPKKTTTIGSKAFGACTSLKKITVNRKNTSINNNAFDKCKTGSSGLVFYCVKGGTVDTFAKQHKFKVSYISEPTDETTKIIPIYRLFNMRTGEHFYTKSASERQAYLKAANWKAEGIAWYAPETSSEPIYRLSNPNNGNEHHYTKSKSERDWLVGLGWKYDCVAWYSDTSKKVPIYRHYHPKQRTGNHHYTTSKGESNHIVKYEGWKYEGVSFYVSKAGG